MQSTLTATAYLGAAIFFILSLGGLSHPETARRGNFYGIVGMTIAVFATLLGPMVIREGLPWIIGAMLLGGAIGIAAARYVRMTQMPELVALMHSLVGLAAVLVGFSNYLDPVIAQRYAGAERTLHEIETCLGVLIGAVTFSGSIMAFGKLSGRISGRPVMLPARHFLNLGLLVAAIVLGYLMLSADTIGSGTVALLLLTAVALAFGVHMVMAIGGADMPVVVSML
ncbi:MAG: NAD(P)(+) transhydrogenase (Re/Si-specific) subunit beta, partial [Gammaproteobacteria bacterium]